MFLILDLTLLTVIKMGVLQTFLTKLLTLVPQRPHKPVKQK